MDRAQLEPWESIAEAELRHRLSQEVYRNAALEQELDMCRHYIAQQSARLAKCKVIIEDALKFIG